MYYCFGGLRGSKTESTCSLFDIYLEFQCIFNFNFHLSHLPWCLEAVLCYEKAQVVALASDVRILYSPLVSYMVLVRLLHVLHLSTVICEVVIGK